MKKKIAVLTFHQSFNYGALLQAYALRDTLNRLGAQADILNYQWKEKSFKVFPFRGMASLKNLVKRCFFVPKLRRIFTPFTKKFLINTIPYDKNNLYKTNDLYDGFIAGSDQIWNSAITGNDAAFLLDFVTDDKKKNSYAASFGLSELGEKDKKIFASALASFNKISVREEPAVKIIKDLTGRDVPQTLDPTLLLSKEVWSQIAVLPKEEDFILLYIMKQDPEIIKFAEDLSKRKNLPLITFANVARHRAKGKYVCASVQQFLGYFIKARCVVTNSFHGLAFSVNFNKDFFAGLLGPSSKINSRVESLLDILELRHRLVGSGGAGPVDYKKVNLILERERQKSLDFLKEIII